MGKLTAVAVKAALANPGTYQDGEGLFLKVDKRGGAYWNLRVQQDGKRRDIGIESAKLLTLADARHKAAELRRAIKVDQRDVLAERKDDAVLRAMWEQGEKLDDPELFLAVLDRAGIDGAALVALSATPEIKGELAANTDSAVARGVFGIPTFFVGHEMFFGKERLGQIDELLAKPASV